MTLALVGNTLLRAAIARNLVTFPGQIQPFMKRTSGDLQERIVQLYFVRGWTVRSICERYAMSKAMVHKLLAEWRVRAIESGYIQEIEPGCLAGLQPEMNGASNDSGYERVALERHSTTPDSVHIVYAGPLPAPLPASNHIAALSAARSA
jgi:hypothetical protein